MPFRPTLCLLASVLALLLGGCARAQPNVHLSASSGAATSLYSVPAGTALAPPAAQAEPGPPADPDEEWTSLTGGRTWERPLADPRWPVFSASYRFQENGRFLDAYEHLSAGDTIALGRGPVQMSNGGTLELELGIQAAVFSVFDPQHEQSLIIIDYMAGAYAAARRGRASGLLRFWHISGHVGDEFLLDEKYGIDDRTPYKFEAIQLMGSYDLPAGFRVYGGPSVLFGVNPSEFGNLILHAGLEWRGERQIFGVARPVAGADVQMVEGLDFNPDLSFRTGLSFDRARRGPAFQVLGEIYTGRDPNGQLFEDRVTFAGVGIYFNL